MQNIYGTPWESIQKMNHKRKIAIWVVIAFFLSLVCIGLMWEFFFQENKTYQLICLGLLVGLWLLRKEIKFLQDQVGKLWEWIYYGEIWLAWELAVANILNTMARNNPDFTVVHDIFIWYENIDHIIIYKDSIPLIIETKAYQKFPSHIRKWHIVHQVERQWKFLQKKFDWVYIKSIVCFTKAFVKPHAKEHNISLINISFLERSIWDYIHEQEKFSHPKHNIIEKLLQLKI